MKLQAIIGFVVLIGTPAIAEDLAPVALNSLSIAPAGIVSAQVFDEHGKPIGRVKKLIADQNGRLSAISFVADGTDRLVIVSASATSYDAQKNILVADTARQQLAENGS